MSQILDPGNSSDQSLFDQIKDITGITDTYAVLDASPYFKAAEGEIIAKVPTAKLPGGRSLDNRTQVEEAIVLLGASYLLKGGKGTNTSTAAIKSETILGIRREYAVSTDAKSENLADFLDTVANEILSRISSSTVEGAVGISFGLSSSRA